MALGEDPGDIEEDALYITMVSEFTGQMLDNTPLPQTNLCDISCMKWLRADTVELCHNHRLKRGPKNRGLVSLKEKELHAELPDMANGSISHTYRMKRQ